MCIVLHGVDRASLKLVEKVGEKGGIRYMAVPPTHTGHLSSALGDKGREALPRQLMHGRPVAGRFGPA